LKYPPSNPRLFEVLVSLRISRRYDPRIIQGGGCLGATPEILQFRTGKLSLHVTGSINASFASSQRVHPFILSMLPSTIRDLHMNVKYTLKTQSLSCSLLWMPILGEAMPPLQPISILTFPMASCPQCLHPLPSLHWPEGLRFVCK